MLGRQRRGVRTRTATVAALLGLVSACMQPSVRPIVGPTGQPAFFVSCPDSGQCYELAGRQCPQGYDIQRAHGTAIESYLVSCKQAGAATAQRYYPANGSYAPAGSGVPAYGWTQPPSAGRSQQWAPPPPPPPPPSAEPAPETAATEGPHGFRPIATDEFDLGY